MGNSITQSIKEQQDKNELEVTETLQMMHKMMENRIAAASSQVGAKNGYHRSIRTRTRRDVSSILKWKSEFFLSFRVFDFSFFRPKLGASYSFTFWLCR